VSRARFASVVLDVDSTLCGVEGIDWLARQRGEDVARLSANLTQRAMDGEMPIEAVYAERLDLIRPTRAEVHALAEVYRETLAPGAAGAIAGFRDAGVRTVLVSGGLRPAIEGVAGDLGVDLFAVDVYWTDDGTYRDFERTSPLARQRGKREIVRSLRLPRPILAVGDGSTDITMIPEVDEFVAFTGFERRAAVVAAASREAATFAELARLVMAD
jgi:phosphoserine phosphatase